MNNSDLDKLNLEKFLNRVAYFNGYDDSEWEKHGSELIDEHKQAIRELIDKKVEEAVEDALWNERVGNE
jgi:hypothetical protein